MISELLEYFFVLGNLALFPINLYFVTARRHLLNKCFLVIKFICVNHRYRFILLLFWIRLQKRVFSFFDRRLLENVAKLSRFLTWNDSRQINDWHWWLLNIIARSIDIEGALLTSLMSLVIRICGWSCHLWLYRIELCISFLSSLGH